MTGGTSSPMSVYLVPLGGARYELYCEVTQNEVSDDEGSDKGWFPGARSRFRSAISKAEEGSRPDPTGDGDHANRGWTRRLGDRATASIAEAIVSQRMLWNLRGRADVWLVYPDDLPEADAIAALRASLRRDADKHRLWFGVDLVAFGASGLLALIPGPNLIAYYFGFRVFGHYFSLRGARHGLEGARWQARPSPLLAELGRVMELPRWERTDRIASVAARLELRHLASFVERLSASGA